VKVPPAGAKPRTGPRRIPSLTGLRIRNMPNGHALIHSIAIERCGILESMGSKTRSLSRSSKFAG